MDTLPVPGRMCGSCMMCCKLTEIPSLKKEAGAWCSLAKVGHGCTKYEERPNECRTFYCDWMLDANWGPEWKPSVAKFMYYKNGITGNFTILPDKGYPDSWRNPLYYSRIKDYACKLLNIGRMAIVVQGVKSIVLLPDRDEAVVTPPDSRIIIRKIETDKYFRYVVIVE